MNIEDKIKKAVGEKVKEKIGGASGIANAAKALSGALKSSSKEKGPPQFQDKKDESGKSKDTPNASIVKDKTEDTISETSKYQPVGATSGIKDPRDLLKSIIGSKYESSSSTPRPTGKLAISPSTIASLFSSKIGSKLGSLSSLVKGADFPAQLAKNTGSKTKFTLKEWEERLGKRPNLVASLNPAGFEPKSLVNSFIDQLFEEKQDRTREEAIKLAEQKGEEYDAIRYRAYQLSHEVEEFAKKYYNTVKYLPPEDYGLIHSLKDEMLMIYEPESYQIKDGTYRDQIVDLTSFMDSLLYQTSSKIRQTPNIPINKVEWNKTYEHGRKTVSDLREIYTENEEPALTLMSDLKDDVKSKGNFERRHTEQTVDLKFKGFEGISKHPVYKNVRTNYVQSGHSSVSKMATDFGTSQPSRQDVQEKVEAQTPTDLTVATAKDGAGDAGEEQEGGDTSGGEKKYGEGVGPITGDKWKTYLVTLGKRESGNDYGKVNTIGFSGRWQFGAAALQDFGYVRKGASTRSLSSPFAWTGKNGIKSQKDFLSNQKVQDSLMLAYTRRNYKSLLRMKVVTEVDAPANVGGYLAAAHLKGPGGARKLKNGQDNKDAYGTSASSYYNMMKGALGGDVTPSDDYKQIVSQTTMPDAATIAHPTGSAAPTYPYNSVTEYEGGHFKEYDSTPGNERIQERHVSGTGYEVMADGTGRHHYSNSKYEAIMGNDYITVSGQCQIVVAGDAGIKVGGSANIDVSNDCNMHVGGDFAQNVDGDMGLKVSGALAITCQGDFTMNAEGDANIASDNDINMEGASMSMAARSGEMNIVSKGDMELGTVGNLKTVASGDHSTVALGDMSIMGEGTASFTGKGNATFGSEGDATLHGASTNVNADGAVSLTGGEVKSNPPVDLALLSAESIKAAVLASVSPVSPTASGGDGGTPENNKKSERVGGKEGVEKAVTVAFQPANTEGTRGWGGGQGEVSNYSGGVFKGSDSA